VVRFLYHTIYTREKETTLQIVPPEQVGISPARLERLTQTLTAYVEHGKLAGTLSLVARRGQVAHFEAHGCMDREVGKRMTDDAIFRIYSMTKPIASLALLMLFEEGNFHLTDPIHTYIPAFQNLRVYKRMGVSGMETEPLERPITFHHLLTHTSGFSYGHNQDSPVEELYRQAKILDPDETLAGKMERLAQLPLYSQPGTVWQYGVSTDIVGRLVELLSGMPLDEFLQTRIFAPLEMPDTAFYVAPEKLGRLVTIYTPAESGGIQPFDGPAATRFSRPRAFLSGGGGLVSTMRDFYRFTQLLRNRGELDGERLIGRKTWELMTANHLPPALLPMQLGSQVMVGYGFGLGVSILLDPAQAAQLGSPGQYGWSGIATTLFWNDPIEDLTGILMTQFMPSGYYPITRSFRMLVYQALAD
jgi:CubicO group peptidase (beta-lactamase class C family)